MGKYQARGECTRRVSSRKVESMERNSYGRKLGNQDFRILGNQACT